MMFNIKITTERYWVRGLFFLAMVMIPLTSYAGIVELIPGIRIATSYNDNIDFRSNSSDAEDDFAGSAVPQLQLFYNTERLDLRGQAEVDFEKYLNETDYDRTNQLYEMQSRFQAHHRWMLLGDYSFRRDETVDSQFEETGRAFQRRRVVRHKATGGVQFALTELSDIGALGKFEKVDNNGGDTTDYDLYTIELPYTKRFQNQIDTIRLTPSHTRYRSDDNEKADGFRLTLFWEHLLSETLTFDITVGGRYTDVEEQNGDTNSNYDYVGNIGLTKRGETFSGLIRYSRDLRSSSEGEIVNVDRLQIFLDKALSERFGFTFKGNGYQSTRENDNESNDKTVSFDLNPGLYYLLTENHSVDLTYSYRNQRELDEPGNPTTQRNRVELSFNFKFPKRWD